MLYPPAIKGRRKSIVNFICLTHVNMRRKDQILACKVTILMKEAFIDINGMVITDGITIKK
jgi:hypothetical protein